MKHLSHIDLTSGELQNATIQNITKPPLNPRSGRLYYDVTDKNLKVFSEGKWESCINKVLSVNGEIGEVIISPSVLEFTSTSNFPDEGEQGKIYLDVSSNLLYRWTGSGYVEISSSIVLGETSDTAYAGDKGKIAYDHSLTTHAPSNAQKNSDITKGEIEAKLVGDITTHSHTVTKSDVGLGNVDNTSDLAKPISTATQTALNTKLDVTAYVDTVQVGGRNLALNQSLDEIVLGGYSTTYQEGVISSSSIPLTGDEYVLSFEAKSTVSGDIIHCHFYNPNTTTQGVSSTGHTSTAADGRAQVVLTSGWKRYWVKYKQSTTTTQKRFIVGRRNPGFGSGSVSVRGIKLELGNKATDWTPAPEDVTAEIASAKQEALTAAGNAQSTANSANTAVGNLNTYVDGAFKDGVIDAAEAKAIEKYKNTLNEAMVKAESSYLKVYTNTYLSGTPKTALQNAKINLWGQRDTLIGAINTAIAGGTTTASQKLAVDNAFGTFNTLMSAFQNALEDANKAIQVKLDDISKGYVDDLEIGGTNLLKNTASGVGWSKTDFDAETRTFTRETTSTSESFVAFIEQTRLENNTTYTLSAWIRSNGQVKNVDYYVYNKGVTKFHSKQGIAVTTNWQFVTLTFTTDSSTDYSESTIRFDNNGSKTAGVNAILYVKEPKLELGNKATDWTPAPEDQVSDWNESNVNSFAFIKNKPAPYTHPNHTGDVTSTGDGATVIAANAVTSTKILNDAVTNSKLANMGANLIKGRLSTTGDPQDLTVTQVKTLLSLKSISEKDYWFGTQANYDAISTKNTNTIYFIPES